MSKYHIKADGNPGLCKATVRSCPRGDDSEHFNSKDEARTAFEETQKSLKLTKRAPIIYEKNIYLSPEHWLSPYDESILEATDAESIDYYSPGYSEITQVDLDRMVSIIIKKPKREWDEELKDFVDSQKTEFEDPNRWEIDAGYYEGDAVTVDGLPDLIEKLEGWYYDQNNAADAHGVLEHVREKGYETKSMRPIDAIKHMLREENNKVLKVVENAKHISVHNIKLSELKYSEAHYKRIEKVKPVVRSKNSNEILGVVLMEQGKTGKRLLDGHHRFKWASEANRTDGNFIVIN